MSLSVMTNDLVHAFPTPHSLSKVRPRTSSISGSVSQSLFSPRHLTRGSSCHEIMMHSTSSPVSSNPQQSTCPPEPVFHSFLRAFYPFTKTYAVSNTTVISLDEGDVVLVHSIHTNGWADGTILNNGTRGWLPTNFCEPYNPEPMQELLCAFLHFWDALRSGVGRDSDFYFGNTHICAIHNGVKSFLHTTRCYDRNSDKLSQHKELKRCRKSIVTNLGTLMKKSQTLLRCVDRSQLSSNDIHEINIFIGEILQLASDIITLCVSLLDICGDLIDSELNSPALEVNVENKNIVCTGLKVESENDMVTRNLSQEQLTVSSNTSSQISHLSRSSIMEVDEEYIYNDKVIAAHVVESTSSSMTKSPVDLSSRNPRDSHHNLSDRVSSSPEQIGAELFRKLENRYDVLLSFLGSFIGKLHLESQTPADLGVAIEHFVAAGEELIRAVAAVYDLNHEIAHAIKSIKDTIEKRIYLLVNASQEIILTFGGDEKAIVTKIQRKSLLITSTDCVKAVEECVEQTKTIIRRVFGLKVENNSRQSDSSYETEELTITNHGQIERHDVEENSENFVTEPSHPPPPPPFFTIPDYQKPLPQVPPTSPSLMERNMGHSTPISPHTLPHSEVGFYLMEAASTMFSLPNTDSTCLSKLPQSEITESVCAQADSSRTSLIASNIDISVDGTSNTSFNSMRGSKSSFVSEISTRATTPDHSLKLTISQTSKPDICMSDSQTSLQDMIKVEAQELGKTYEHELMFNKDGGVIGGTLPALVERLTNHDSTPDSIFFSTFLLTFRLFVSPLDLSKALVERFDYIALSPTIATPVRLRVLNVFKSWLEYYWKNSTDHDALSIIRPFASEKLSNSHPKIAERLLELVLIVSTPERPHVPRMVSSMGKISASVTQPTLVESPLPSPIMNKASMSSLRNWKSGSNQPTILDFDPLEIARHLTMMGIQIFCSIQPGELLDSEWTKGPDSQAPNVRAMATLSTDLSNFATDSILQFEDPKKRAMVIKHWIKIADKCLELHNYDSLMAIMCTLNSSTIDRLKRTWDFVSSRRKEMLKGLRTIVEPDKNLANLRRRLNDHVPPCLPFVGMYLTDLTFVDAGNSSTRQIPGTDGAEGTIIINFDKHTRTAKIISELQRFQLPYRFAEVPDLKDWLQTQIARVKSFVNTEQGCHFYRKSLLLEPRESHNLSRSPTDASFTTLQREKFDIFGWATKERNNSLIPPLTGSN